MLIHTNSTAFSPVVYKEGNCGFQRLYKNVIILLRNLTEQIKITQPKARLPSGYRKKETHKL